MNKINILVVEDDTLIRNLIVTTLKSNDYNYISARSGKEAITLASSYNPDIILLDLGLPDIDGIDVLDNIRSWSIKPVLILSARSEVDDKIEALDHGADDYLTKPFSTEELLARIRVMIRRLNQIQGYNSNPQFISGPLSIDYAAGIVRVDNKEIHLTPIEYKLLTLLTNNAGKVLTHSYICQHIWGSNYEADGASLRVFMASLRKKIEIGDYHFIQTHVGIGYRMNKI